MALPPFEIRDDGLTFANSLGSEWLRVPWEEVRLLEAVDPVPAFVLHGADGMRQPFAPGGEDEDDFVDRTVAVFDAAERAGVPLERGWLDHPRVEWSRVDALPGGPASDAPASDAPASHAPASHAPASHAPASHAPASHAPASDAPASHAPASHAPASHAPASGGGAYRGAAGEAVIARRGSGSPTEGLLLYLLRRERSLPEHVQIVLTDGHVYEQRVDGSVWRIPRAQLRRVFRTRSGDLVSVFGRDTRLVIPGRPGCPLEAALEAQLPES